MKILDFEIGENYTGHFEKCDNGYQVHLVKGASQTTRGGRREIASLEALTAKIYYDGRIRWDDAVEPDERAMLEAELKERIRSI